MDHLHGTRRSFLQSSLAATATLSASRIGFADEEAPDRPFNRKIEHAREVALSLLKPSVAQLEHGMQLHAESVVFDSYAFAPRCAVDGDALAELSKAGASNLEFQDAREDMLMTRCVNDADERREFLEAWRASGVTCIYQNAGEEGQSISMLLKRLARFTYLTDMLPDHVSKAAIPDDVIKAKEAGRHCQYLTGNGVPLNAGNDLVEEES